VLAAGWSAPSHAQLLVTAVSPDLPEYIELYNPTSARIPLEGLALAYYPDSRTTWAEPYRTFGFPEGAAVQPHGFFLITFGVDGCSGDWAASEAPLLHADGAAVAVLRGAAHDGNVVDAVGWGTSHLAIGGVAPAPARDLCLVRKPGQTSAAPFAQTADNAADFAPAPRAPRTAYASAVILVEQPWLPATSSMLRISVWNTSAVGRILHIDSSSDVGLRTETDARTAFLLPWEVETFDLDVLPYSFSALDFETSGLDDKKDAIIEAGCARFVQGQMVQSSSSLVRFEDPLDPYITWLTGITSDMLTEAPQRKDVIPAVLDALGDGPVVTFSVNRFDPRFLAAATAGLGLPFPETQWIDGHAWAMSSFAEVSDYSLESLGIALGLRPQVHRALSDAILAGQVFVESVRRTGCSLFLSATDGETGLPLASAPLFINGDALFGGTR